MKTYAYFPGCSLEKTGLSYHNSTLETTSRLGIELEELEDWNCCGATAYFHMDEILANTLCARNLAMAEKIGKDLVVPCAACFKNTYFANRALKTDPDLKEHINVALAEDDLHFDGSGEVRHLLKVFVDEIGFDALKEQVSKPLEGLKVATYYGCQVLRPQKDHENVEDPHFFEELMEVIGAEPVPFATKARCCGGSLLISSREAALSMIHMILKTAVDNEAEVIATACPMCQINLECYQNQVNEEYGTHFRVPVVYFTQLVGLAMGIPNSKIGLGSELVKATSLAEFAA
ncbi:MAG: CoB--CoM heterodisulfide reductase iron-sulfur subunit B family protein [Anaerolineales bacterium]|jgi:heterodisulfide reductase subunit B